MSFIKKYIKLFYPNSEEEKSVEQIKQYRFYGLAGVVITGLVSIFLTTERTLFNYLAQGLIAAAFLTIIITTFYTNREKIISRMMFWLILAVTLYTTHNAYLHHFSIHNTFSLLIILFVFSLMLKTKKEITYYYLMLLIFGTVEIIISSNTEIPKIHLVSFIVLFTILGYVVIIGKLRVFKKLEEKELFHKTLFNKAFDCIMLVDYYSREVIDCNDVAVKMFEVGGKNEIIGYSREQFIKNKMSEDELLMCRREFSKNDIWRSEVECISKKGREFWAEIAITPLLLKSDQYYVTRMTDITFKKDAEKVIIENEMKYRSLVENMGEGILNSDIKGVTVFVNERFCEILEYDKKDLIGSKITDSIKFAKESKLIYEENKQKSLEGEFTNYNIKIMKKSGQWVWAEVSGAPVFDNEGKITGVMGIFTDITQRKYAEEKIQESRENFKRWVE